MKKTFLGAVIVLAFVAGVALGRKSHWKASATPPPTASVQQKATKGSLGTKMPDDGGMPHPPHLQGTYTDSPKAIPHDPTFLRNNTAGSLLVAVVSGEVDQATMPTGNPTVTDSLGNRWSLITSDWVYYWTAETNHYQYTGLFSATNTNGTGVEKITVHIANWHKGTQSSVVMIDEFHPPAGTYILDGKAFGIKQGITGPPGQMVLVGPTISPSTADDLIYAFAVDNSASGQDIWAPGSDIFRLGQKWNWNNLDAYPGVQEYGTLSTAAKISPSFKFSTTAGIQFWTIVTAGFKVIHRK
jgi:hypothetical protein